MCGRFSLTVTAETLASEFGCDPPERMAPRYNIAPGQPVLALRERSVRADRELVLLLWGLVPSWAKDAAIGNKMINARAETLAEKPSFRAALRHRRCLVPVDGFYEWRSGPGGKHPFHIRRQDGRPFAIAGLWEQWIGPGGEELSTCALITCEANSFMSPLHGRMPVVLAPDEHPRWLSRAEGKPAALAPLLAPREWNGFEARPVSTYVNIPANEGPRCLEAPAGALPL
ncbi:MAG: SOS response-associated peptidase [Deltaproteobacteria bacterium]|nr:SOS response-associated peptidase [Deltaproteobacteria bacterium]